MSKWHSYSLEDLAADSYAAIVDGPFGSNLKTTDYVESGIPVLQGNNITKDKFIWRDIRFITPSKSRSLIRSAARIGDILTVKIGSVGYSAIVNHLENYQYAIIPANLIKSTFSNNKVVTKFVYYLLTSEFGKRKLRDLAGNTAQPALSLKNFKAIIFQYPSLPEQRKIAEILTTVDNLIEQTEALIAKYQAVKQGMMHDLFTRGVDKTGRLRPPRHEAPELYKDSPLGWIPKEWEVVKVLDYTESITSGSRGWAQYYSEHGDVFIRIGNLTREHINFRLKDIQRVLFPHPTEGLRTSLEADDILISITADLGIVAVVPQKFPESYINQHIALVRIRSNEINNRYVGHFFASNRGQNQIQRLNDSGAKSGLNLPTVGSFMFPKTKIKEQEAVTSTLDNLDFKIASTNEEVQKYQSIKSGLMHDLLIGKVRVPQPPCLDANPAED